MLISAAEARTIRNDGPIFMYVSWAFRIQHNLKLFDQGRRIRRSHPHYTRGSAETPGYPLPRQSVARSAFT